MVSKRTPEVDKFHNCGDKLEIVNILLSITVRSSRKVEELEVTNDVPPVLTLILEILLKLLLTISLTNTPVVSSPPKASKSFKKDVERTLVILPSNAKSKIKTIGNQ